MNDTDQRLLKLLSILLSIFSGCLSGQHTLQNCCVLCHPQQWTCLYQVEFSVLVKSKEQEWNHQDEIRLAPFMRSTSDALTEAIVLWSTPIHWLWPGRRVNQSTEAFLIGGRHHAWVFLTLRYYTAGRHQESLANKCLFLFARPFRTAAKSR